MGKQRLVAIGIDSAEWDDLQAMVDRGELPNMAKHLAGSALATTEGDLPYRAEASWTEFLTGRVASENRYWTTAAFDPRTYETWEIGAYRGTPFYARPDLSVISFDVPHATIAPEARGAQVTAWGAHSAQYPTASSPSDLVSRIDRTFGVHRAPRSDSHAGWHNETYGRNLTEALVDGLRQKVEISRWLSQQFPDWDLFCTVLSETHTAGHQFFHGVHADHPLHALPVARPAAERFAETWRAADDAVGGLVDALADDDTTVMLFAVHGMRGNGSDVTGLVLFPELLHRLAFGRPFIDFPAWDPSQPPLVLDPEMTASDHLMRHLAEPKGAMYGSRTAELKNRVAWEVRNRLSEEALRQVEGLWRKATGSERKNQWAEMDVRPPAPEFVDVTAGYRKPLDYHTAAWYCGYWPRMKAFVLPSFSDAHVRVNLRGRERDGVVGADDYEAVLDDLERTFAAVTDARTGRPVVEEMVRMRSGDPFDPDGPSGDLVVTFSEVSDVIEHPDAGIIGPAPLLRSGEHSTHGWAAIRPPAGASGSLGHHRPRDLAPTIIDLLGRPPSPLVTGRSFAEGLGRLQGA